MDAITDSTPEGENAAMSPDHTEDVPKEPFDQRLFARHRYWLRMRRLPFQRHRILNHTPATTITKQNVLQPKLFPQESSTRPTNPTAPGKGPRRRGCRRGFRLRSEPAPGGSARFMRPP